MVIDYLGIYGVCLKENKVLSIKKARGPYKNRFDLPGGSQKTSEGFTETLVREFLEETGYKVSSYDNCRAYDVFVEEEERTVHHMMVFYDVEIESDQLEEIQTVLDDEINDSDGICWLEINKINIDNASPLLLKLKQEILNDSNILEKKEYKSWRIL